MRPTASILPPQSMLDTRAKVRVGNRAGMVFVEFEREISWLTFSKNEAIQFIEALAEYTNRLP